MAGYFCSGVRTARTRTHFSVHRREERLLTIIIHNSFSKTSAAPTRILWSAVLRAAVYKPFRAPYVYEWFRN